MRKQISIILFLALSFSAIGQSFVDTLALNNYIRANIRDRRPEKVSAENIQQALLGITKFLNSGADSNVFSTRNWVSTQGFSKYSDTNSIFGSKAWVTNQSFTRNADTSNMLLGYVRGSFTAGQLPFANGTRSVAGSANLFWDNTNGRLGVGTASPSYRIHVNGGDPMFANSNDVRMYFNTSQNFIRANANFGWFDFTTNNVSRFNIGSTVTSSVPFSAASELLVQNTATDSVQLRLYHSFASHFITAKGGQLRLERGSVTAKHTSMLSLTNSQAGFFTNSPHASAALHINSELGILIPTMTSVTAGNIASPANGLMYYNTDSLRLMIRRSGQWRGVRFTDEGSGGASLPAGNNLDILRNRGGTWVAEPDTTTTNGFVNVTGGTLLQYSGGWATAAINDSAILSKKQIDSLLAAGNGRKFLYSTANTTPVNAAVQSIANNTAGQIEISVTVTSGSGSIKIIRRSFGYKKITGTLTLYTPWDLISPVADSGMSTADVNLVNSSGNAAIQVTGIAGSLDWSIELKFVALINIPV